MRKHLVFILFFLISLNIPLLAQKTEVLNLKKLSKDEKAKYENAEYFYSEKDYLRALPLFLDLMEAHPDELYFKMKSGICYFYKTDEKEKSIPLLEEVEKANPKMPDIYFFLGRAYHMNYKFDEAIAAFNKYLELKPPINQQLLTKQYIDYSKRGKAFLELKMRCDINNVGKPINSEYNEYVPVISSDESVLIFTYVGPGCTGGLMDSYFEPDPNGQYYEDVYISQRVGKNWLSPESIGSNINTNNHDACIALSADGQILFIYHSTENDGGDIYMSKLDGDVWGVPENLGPNINTKYWEGSCSLSSDGQTLYFASERPGGLGGRDIYISQKQTDGTWGPAKNLGPSINTKLNEDSPFIHPDDITLYFSSEGHNSIGGYDIMYSTLKGEDWSEPTNLGYPINTPGDERFYVLTADGEHGYFSSDRKGGVGGQDIYTVNPGFFGEKPILALVLGTVTANDKPVGAIVNVSNDSTGQKEG